LARKFCKHDHFLFLIYLAQTVKVHLIIIIKELLLSDVSLTGTFAIVVYGARLASVRLALSLSIVDVTTVTVDRTH